MEKQIRNVAVSFAVITFFLMAGVGLLCNLPPAVCCNRALIGAAITYAVVSMSGKIALRIILGQIVDSQYRREEHKNDRQ